MKGFSILNPNSKRRRAKGVKIQEKLNAQNNNNNDDEEDDEENYD